MSTTYWEAVRLKDASGNVSAFSNRDSATTTAPGGTTPLYTLDFEEGTLADLTSAPANGDTCQSWRAHSGSYGMKITGSSGTPGYKTITEWIVCL